MPWTTRYHTEDRRPFVVDDGTGSAYVDPEGAELTLQDGFEVASSSGDELPANVRAFLEREAELDPADQSGKRRYREYRIDVGESVVVAGHADPDGAPADRGATTAITRAGEAPRFYVSDDPGHGLGSRLLRQALASFLAAAILLGAAAVLYSP